MRVFTPAIGCRGSMHVNGKGEAIRWWKWSNWDRYGRAEIPKGLGAKGCMGLTVCLLVFASLAWNTASCPFSNVLQHGRPDEAVLDEALWARIPGGERGLWRGAKT
ncbi:hypothetical protein TNIN_420111 [Trichonephila inaurata madagascariensis]|uniref:Uncharacterized protein n=1 Tax=Trichonephila inaurata madagascariensis TaxID=2747483 RepID=A0A8X6WTQ5_9ARAC|nr:hypothetical protein TNIN_420111 [Trichonephila inaurata madagascariensis]